MSAAREPGVSRLVVDVPGNEWMTSNGRYNRFDRARRSKSLRTRAWALATAALLPRYTCRVRVDYHVVTRRAGRIDPANAYPTVKPIIDGMTDAGVWVDDDDAHLDGPVPHRGPVDRDMLAGWHRIILTITPLEEEP